MKNSLYKLMRWLLGSCYWFCCVLFRIDGEQPERFRGDPRWQGVLGGGTWSGSPGYLIHLSPLQQVNVQLWHFQHVLVLPVEKKKKISAAVDILQPLENSVFFWPICVNSFCLKAVLSLSPCLLFRILFGWTRVRAHSISLSCKFLI